MASNISRRPARISPTFITRWRRRRSAARRWTRDWRNWKPAPPTASWRRAASAIDICRGIKAFADGDNDGAIRLLEPAMAEVVRIGGSHAQRELWEDTLIVAYLRGGHARRRPG